MKLVKRERKMFLWLVIMAVLGCFLMLFINSFVCQSVKSRILTEEQAKELDNVDCILVLGCLVRPGGVPSGMLEDRLLCGYHLYDAAVAPKLLMSGDHGQTDYDEVNAMKQYVMKLGVDSEDVFMDHAGFSTYESMYRAKEIFQAKKVVIVTQEYHLYRAVYVAKKLGLDAYGVPADYHTYGGQRVRDLREVLARCKDFMTSIVKPKPKFLGETIPISGSGDLTND